MRVLNKNYDVAQITVPKMNIDRKFIYMKYEEQEEVLNMIHLLYTFFNSHKIAFSNVC